MIAALKTPAPAALTPDLVANIYALRSVHSCTFFELTWLPLLAPRTLLLCANSTCLSECLQGLNDLLHIPHSQQCQAHWAHWANVGDVLNRRSIKWHIRHSSANKNIKLREKQTVPWEADGVNRNWPGGLAESKDLPGRCTSWNRTQGWDALDGSFWRTRKRRQGCGWREGVPISWRDLLQWERSGFLRP